MLVASPGALPVGEPYDGDTRLGKEDKPLTKSDFRLLAPHLERTTMLFASGRKDELKLILSCVLTLDEWTGEPKLNPEISVASSGVHGSGGAKVEREAKKLFRGLLMHRTKEGDEDVRDVDADVIVQAIEGVMGVLFGIDIISGTGRKETMKS